MMMVPASATARRPLRARTWIAPVARSGPGSSAQTAKDEGLGLEA
jgi:hypothetical protein